MSKPDTILIIEDDQALAGLVRDVLNGEGFHTRSEEDGAVGLELARESKPSLILLDINLPTLSGLEICRALKQDERTRSIPIVMLTGRISETDTVLGLELGADDYIAKPFRAKELGARIRAVLRRGRALPSDSSSEEIELGPIRMNSSRHEVTIAGSPLSLTLTEFRLLWVLASHPGKVFTREQLLERVAKGDSNVVDRNVDVHIGSLRKKLADHASLIVTVRGIGYKCRDDLGSSPGLDQKHMRRTA